jgi:hypothetical protein
MQALYTVTVSDVYAHLQKKGEVFTAIRWPKAELLQHTYTSKVRPFPCTCPCPCPNAQNCTLPPVVKTMA